MRAFVALELPKPLRQRLAEARQALTTGGAKVRWVEADNIHLTLKFLAEINASQAEAMAGAVRESAGRFPPLRLGIGGLGAFPNRRNPRVIWVGVNPSEELIRLQKNVESVATEVGVPPEERAFSPHLTLGRVKFVDRHSPLLERLRSVRVETFFYMIDTVTLFESRLTPEGPVYTAIERATLQATAAG